MLQVSSPGWEATNASLGVSFLGKFAELWLVLWLMTVQDGLPIAVPPTHDLSPIGLHSCKETETSATTSCSDAVNITDSLPT